jgi:hypothetical protein
MDGFGEIQVTFRCRHPKMISIRKRWRMAEGRVMAKKESFQLGARRGYGTEVVRCSNDREGMGVLHEVVFARRLFQCRPPKEDVDSEEVMDEREVSDNWS